MVKNNKDNDFSDKKLLNIDSVTVNTIPSSDNELTSEIKYTDNIIGEITVPRFNQTLQNYLEVSVGNDTHNLTKNDKIQITDTIIIKNSNKGGYLLQQWNMNAMIKKLMVKHKGL